MGGFCREIVQQLRWLAWHTRFHPQVPHIVPEAPPVVIPECRVRKKAWVLLLTPNMAQASHHKSRKMSKMDNHKKRSLTLINLVLPVRWLIRITSFKDNTFKDNIISPCNFICLLLLKENDQTISIILQHSHYTCQRPQFHTRGPFFSSISAERLPMTLGRKNLDQSSLSLITFNFDSTF